MQNTIIVPLNVECKDCEILGCVKCKCYQCKMIIEYITFIKAFNKLGRSI